MGDFEVLDGPTFRFSGKHMGMTNSAGSSTLIRDGGCAGVLSRLRSWFRPVPPVPSIERPFFFLHIPKTAGMTVRHFLAMRFPAGQTYNVPARPSRIDDPPLIKRDAYELHRRRPHLALLNGSSSFPGSHIYSPFFADRSIASCPTTTFSAN